MPDDPNITANFPKNADMPQEQSLIDLLFSDHLLTQEQYDDIKVKSATQAQSADTILESLHIVPEDKIFEAKAKILGVPFTITLPLSITAMHEHKFSASSIKCDV